MNKKVLFTFILLFSLLLNGCQNSVDSNIEAYDPHIAIIIKDLSSPIIELQDYFTVEINQDFNIYDYLSVKDNLDQNPKIEIIGEIITTVAGTYDLEIKAFDQTGNISNKRVKVEVIEKKKNQPENNSNNEAKTPSSEAVQQPSSNMPSSALPAVTSEKYYLFSDGYNIETAPASCANDLFTSQRSGKCINLMDENGIYYGSKLILN